ncbi:hypothetical protein ACFQ9Q_37925 [Streptomyces virginiae]|uniref:hypothetical protein n=1 Tax=Streptomyces virginiae TaxID=1961 RepID=UPI00368B1F6A
MAGIEAVQLDARLAQLGVNKKIFVDALEWAAGQARMCTEFDAPSMSGITFWSRANRFLAEHLRDPKYLAEHLKDVNQTLSLWKYTRRDSILRVVHPAGTHAITAISGSGGIANLDRQVRSKNPKGRAMAVIVENNAKFERRTGQSVIQSRDDIEFGGELEEMPLWFLLYERTAAGLAAELSLPVKMEGRYVNEWSERIPLFTLPDPGVDIELLDAPDDDNGVHIPVQFTG